MSLLAGSCRREGRWGRRLVAAAVQHARSQGARRLLVSTAACDTALLRFYQQLAFRMLRIARAGYATGLEVDGIPLRDRVWLDRDV